MGGEGEGGGVMEGRTQFIRGWLEDCGLVVQLNIKLALCIGWLLLMSFLENKSDEEKEDHK